MMIDCKINDVSKNAVNISDRCIFRENLIYILKSDVLTVNVAEMRRMKRINLKVEKIEMKKRI